MPNFTIRRRRKKVEEAPPEVAPAEEKIDNTEEYMSESSDETAIDDAMRDLNIQPAPRTQSRPQYRQSEPPPVPKRDYTRPQYQNPTNVARQPTKYASYPQRNPTRPHIPNQYQRTPTMAIQNPRSKRKGGGTRLRFNSHYGTGGEHLDTHTKSLMLYNHCFG